MATVSETDLEGAALDAWRSVLQSQASILRALDVPAAHVAGFSMGSTIAQELALRHPELVRSLVLVSTFARPDALLRSQFAFWRWLAEAAPSAHAFFEEWDIDDEPGEVAIRLEGDVGLVPLP